MTKEEFLNNPDVSKFIQWFCNKLSNFPHSYYNHREKKDWCCASFYEACEKYSWANHGWEDTQKTLDSLSIHLKESINNTNNAACEKICCDILKWGGVLRGNQTKLKEINNKECLCAYLAKANDFFRRNYIENIEEGIIMNSGFTKIYSLYINDFIIYDSRVGAALCYMVKLYCEEQKLKEIPEQLKFAYGNSRNSKVNRNPNNEIYKFPLLDRGKIHIECNIKANWLLKEVLNVPICKFKDLRSLEAALFMIGYKIPLTEEQKIRKAKNGIVNQ